MDLIGTMSNLVIDEGPALEEGITNETAAGNERTISEDEEDRSGNDHQLLVADAEVNDEGQAVNEAGNTKNTVAQKK
ncbi:hypothetical protein JOM56_008138 [Amanita muscaria]